MSFTPIAGPTAVLKISVSSSFVVQPAISWKLSIDGKLTDISNFLTGRTPALTLTDVDFEFTLIYDDSTPPTDSDLANIRPGTVISGQCYVNSSKFYALSAMISTVAPAIESLEDVLKLPVTAKITGTLTYPTNLS